MPDDNVTPLRPAEDPPPASAAPETFAGPGWTGQVIYPGGAPPRVPSSDPPPPETMPSAAAEGAREDLDDAAAELARRVHGPEGGFAAGQAEAADPHPAVVDALPDPPDDPPRDNPEAEAWRETAREYAGHAARWRARAEAAEDRMAVAEGAHLGLQTRILAAEALADALEALAGNVRPLVPRLPVRQREAIYQAHGRALEALTAYRKLTT